jgi:hypothetical protein
MRNETVPTLEEARKYIDSIDFSQIIDKMVQRDGWLKGDALKICAFYRNHLYLRKKYSSTHRMPPSVEIDEMWHYHILDIRPRQQYAFTR